MKFLCVPCNEPMKLQQTRPPDRGSLTVVYACEACGYEMAMLTNAMETQLVQSLGVRIGPAGEEKKCPFAGTIPAAEPKETPADGRPAWTAEAEARLANVPIFVRPMARSGIESFARERGYATIDARVMDEARGHFGM